MTIDSLRCSLNEPEWYSRANDAHPLRRIDDPITAEPSGVMRRVDNKPEHVDGILRQLDLALAIIYRLLPRDKDGEPGGVSFDSFRTDAGPRAQIVKSGNMYDVAKRKANGS